MPEVKGLRVTSEELWAKDQEAQALTKLLNNKKSICDDRIPRIIGLLQQYWQKYPSLRLGQVLTNLLGEDNTHYINDNELENKLRDILSEKETK